MKKDITISILSLLMFVAIDANARVVATENISVNMEVRVPTCQITTLDEINFVIERNQRSSDQIVGFSYACDSAMSYFMRLKAANQAKLDPVNKHRINIAGRSDEQSLIFVESDQKLNGIDKLCKSTESIHSCSLRFKVGAEMNARPGDYKESVLMEVYYE